MTCRTRHLRARSTTARPNRSSVLRPAAFAGPTCMLTSVMTRGVRRHSCSATRPPVQCFPARSKAGRVAVNPLVTLWALRSLRFREIKSLSVTPDHLDGAASRCFCRVDPDAGSQSSANQR